MREADVKWIGKIIALWLFVTWVPYLFWGYYILSEFVMLGSCLLVARYIQSTIFPMHSIAAILFFLMVFGSRKEEGLLYLYMVLINVRMIGPAEDRYLHCADNLLFSARDVVELLIYIAIACTCVFLYFLGSDDHFTILLIYPPFYYWAYNAFIADGYLDKDNRGGETCFSRIQVCVSQNLPWISTVVSLKDRIRMDGPYFAYKHVALEALEAAMQFITLDSTVVRRNTFAVGYTFAVPIIVTSISCPLLWYFGTVSQASLFELIQDLAYITLWLWHLNQMFDSSYAETINYGYVISIYSIQKTGYDYIEYRRRQKNETDKDLTGNPRRSSRLHPLQRSLEDSYHDTSAAVAPAEDMVGFAGRSKQKRTKWAWWKPLLVTLTSGCIGAMPLFILLKRQGEIDCTRPLGGACNITFVPEPYLPNGLFGSLECIVDQPIWIGVNCTADENITVSKYPLSISIRDTPKHTTIPFKFTPDIGRFKQTRKLIVEDLKSNGAKELALSRSNILLEGTLIDDLAELTNLEFVSLRGDLYGGLRGYMRNWTKVKFFDVLIRDSQLSYWWESSQYIYFGTEDSWITWISAALEMGS